MSEVKYTEEEIEKIKDQIYDAMKEVPEVTKTEVKLVWTPAWTVEKMSRYARIALGIR